MVGRMGSQDWGTMPSPLHAVRVKRCGHLVLFEQRAFQARHVQEQTRLPPWLANGSKRGLHGRRLLWGSMLRACLCGVRAHAAAGSCNEANMPLRACLCRARWCLCCMRALAFASHNCHVLPACSPCLALLVLGCQELFFALLCLLMLGRP